ncbi:hypothetical protein NMY22_g10610 [Coprinellus aureogranulatus]|nr:hypothetical protein NMY22_g10610 [Coprinellus aureogranulatus]
MVGLSDTARQSLDEYIDSLTKDPRLPSFIFGATTAEATVYLRGSGFRVVGDPSSGDVDEDTAFWVCSEGKPITHLAAVQLVERGQLSLNAPVSDYFPEFSHCVIVDPPACSDASASHASESSAPATVEPHYRLAQQVMTVEHLMHHTSGLYYSGSSPQDWEKDLNNPYSFPQSAEDPVGDFLRWIKGDFPGIPLKFEPGTSWAYGWSSDILGFVIEKASGMNLEEYLQENIFEPLSMTRTSFYRTPRILENIVSIGFRREGSDAFVPWNHRFYETDPKRVHLFCGGAHLISSSRDYLAFLRHLLQIHSGTVDPRHAVVSRETLLKYLTPSLNASGQDAIQAFLNSSVPPSEKPSVQWANGQAVTTVDWEGRRRSGSGFYPTTGVAAVLQAHFPVRFIDCKQFRTASGAIALSRSMGSSPSGLWAMECGSALYNANSANSRKRIPSGDVKNPGEDSVSGAASVPLVSWYMVILSLDDIVCGAIKLNGEDVRRRDGDETGPRALVTQAIYERPPSTLESFAFPGDSRANVQGHHFFVHSCLSPSCICAGNPGPPAKPHLSPGRILRLPSKRAPFTFCRTIHSRDEIDESAPNQDFTKCLEKADLPSCQWYLDQLKACQAAAAPY